MEGVLTVVPALFIDFLNLPEDASERCRQSMIECRVVHTLTSSW